MTSSSAVHSIEFINSSGGRYLMGASENERYENRHELPRHEVSRFSMPETLPEQKHVGATKNLTSYSANDSADHLKFRIMREL